MRNLRQQAGLSQAELAEITGYSEKTIRRWEKGEAAPRQAVIELLRARVRPAPVPEPTPKTFTFIDLFAGIGGLRRGFEAAGGKCLFTSEWDKYAQQTYRANFQDDHEIRGDIRKVEVTDVPEHDILLAGFPCQPFSIAGVSKKNALGRPHGFACQTQGTLFFEVARILEARRPKAFLLENVKNLRTHDQGNTFKVIQHTLSEELGYSIYWRIVNGQGFVPQHRERLLIVGFKDPMPFDWDEVRIPDPRTGPRLRSILHPEDGAGEVETRYTDERGRPLAKYQLTDHLWSYLQSYAEKHRASGNGFGFGLFGPDDVARTLSARYYKDGSEILIRTPVGNPRRLTPRECARLMGFDRVGRKPMEIPVSDTQAYRQLGNAVIVPVIEAVAEAMVATLQGKSEAQQLSLPLVAAVA